MKRLIRTAAQRLIAAEADPSLLLDEAEFWQSVDDRDLFYARELVVAVAGAYVKTQRLPILGDSRR